MMKANWTVIEPEGLPAALERALRVAMTPPVGPVHLAVYDRLLGPAEYTANIIDGHTPEFAPATPPTPTWRPWPALSATPSVP